MRWRDHLRNDPEAFNSYREFIEQQRQEAFRHFLNAKSMDGMERVKGRVEALDGLDITLTEPDQEILDATERDARRRRAESGIRLAH